MNIRKPAIAILIASMLTLSACASIPNMTQEQEEMISEYSTALLLKYDKENHSRLVNTSGFIKEYNQALLEHSSNEAANVPAVNIEDEELRREENKQQEEAMKEYTGSIDHSNDGTGGATVVNNTSIGEYLGFNNFSFECTGISVADSYPESGNGDMFFSLDATKGNKLLIVYFDVKNTSDSKTLLDIYNMGANFKLDVNSRGGITTFKTMLEDDLSDYLGEFNPGETKQLVLMMEVKDGTSIDSLGLSIGVSGKEVIKKILK